MGSRDSVRASSIWPEMPFMRGPAGAQRLREWLPTYRQQRAQTAARRERVLAYDWACKRLCVILGLTNARNWNGYVPAAVDSDGRPNTAENRRQLIELLRDVARADAQAVTEVPREDAA